MRYATLDGAQRSEPTPGAVGGVCPTCGSAVVPKCGELVTWHWAHARRDDCDDWAEGMTDWHLQWQDMVPIERREVVIGGRRVSMLGADNRPYCLVSGGLTADDVRSHEDHFGKRMVWVIDARDAYAAERIDLRVKVGRPATYRTFRWKHARKSLSVAQGIVVLDLGRDTVFLMRKLYPGVAPSGGYGMLLPMSDMTAIMNASS